MDIKNYGLQPLDFNAADHKLDGSATVSPGGFSRRAFMMTSLAVGFAIASKPVLAQAITTDTHGLVAGEVSVPVADGHIPAYRAMPSAGKNFPVIVVIQEIFGVHEHIKDMCRRFAKLGTVGYCWGGRAVWLYAAHNPSVKAAVAYYGLLNGMKSEIKANDPVDIAQTLKVPVLGLYASMDAFIKPEIIEQMQAGLEKSGSGSEIVVFPNVNHGFNADYRPTYNKTAAQYAWKLTQDWLKNHGV